MSEIQDDRNVPSRPSSAASNRSVDWKTLNEKKKALKKARIAELGGLTPEEIHEIRYAGIKYDTQIEVTSASFEASLPERNRTALRHHRLANEGAMKALDVYKILMYAEAQAKLVGLAEDVKKFDLLGEEPFALMHTMRAYLGTKPDHAPAEITVVRYTLSGGVAKGDHSDYHVFPSPLPIPFGKSAEYLAGRKEWHEIDHAEFPYFSDDYILIFYDILRTLDPNVARKTMQRPKYPLVICKSNLVNQVMMSFEYLHQRALLAQRDGFETKAPSWFVVPTDIPVVFCDFRIIDDALRSFIREMDPNKTKTKLAGVDRSWLNLCVYHKNTNKIYCTTYQACELFEQMLVFCRLWSNVEPRRFVSKFDISSIQEYSPRIPNTPEPQTDIDTDSESGMTSSSDWETASESDQDEMDNRGGLSLGGALQSEVIRTRAEYVQMEQLMTISSDMSDTSSVSDAITMSSGSITIGRTTTYRPFVPKGPNGPLAPNVRPKSAPNGHQASIGISNMKSSQSSGSVSLGLGVGSGVARSNPTPSPTGALENPLRAAPPIVVRYGFSDTDSFSSAESETETGERKIRRGTGRGLPRMFASMNINGA